MDNERIDIKVDKLKKLTEEIKSNNSFDEDYYKRVDVKRGLRNADGTGVLAGLTRISNVHGYIIDEYERVPREGELFYRGINIKSIIDGCVNEERFGFEETAWLLLFGSLPTKEELDYFIQTIELNRDLPKDFVEDMIMKAASPNIMNKLARGVLALYSYEENTEDNSVENILRQSISLISRLPSIMVAAYQVKRRVYDGQSIFLHQPLLNLSFAENILSMLRFDRQFTREEALLLDKCLILHAEHGGGNNSTFACRVLSSSGTDTYSAIAAGIGSLKGPRHGGANIKVCEMLDCIKKSVKNYNDDEEIKEFLFKLMRKEEGDRSGLIYGMGHAVYTLSDPRTIILKENAKKLVKEKGFEDDFRLLDAVERLSPEVLRASKGDKATVCANVDLYSGLVYRMLGIPEELYTPLFAVARMAGWCAHRIEEVASCKKIIRPAYRPILEGVKYIPISERKD
ncbi:MAG: citrate synthase [Candidatus Margulisbacteria bacterium GWF2_35_9]|nr:MAG: citrate synthase [Candidatus Margulisbacteria bacterium GWF2_35_9]